MPASHRRSDEELEELAGALLDEREADRPHAGAHEIHAEEARHQEVDVARAALGHLEHLRRRSGRFCRRRVRGPDRPRVGPGGCRAASDRTSRSADRCRAPRARGVRWRAHAPPRAGSGSGARAFRSAAQRRRPRLGDADSPRCRPAAARADDCGRPHRGRSPAAPGRERPRRSPRAHAGTRATAPA